MAITQGKVAKDARATFWEILFDKTGIEDVSFDNTDRPAVFLQTTDDEPVQLETEVTNTRTAKLALHEVLRILNNQEVD